jgi:hypothetical protein
MKESYVKGVVTHPDPESCTGSREAEGEAYAQGVEGRLRGQHDRAHRGAYRAQPSRRVYILKGDGRQRP